MSAIVDVKDARLTRSEYMQIRDLSTEFGNDYLMLLLINQLNRYGDGIARQVTPNEKVQILLECKYMHDYEPERTMEDIMDDIVYTLIKLEPVYD